MTRIFKGINIEKLRRAVGFELKQVIKSHYVYGKQWVVTLSRWSSDWQYRLLCSSLYINTKYSSGLEH